MLSTDEIISCCLQDLVVLVSFKLLIRCVNFSIERFPVIITCSQTNLHSGPLSIRNYKHYRVAVCDVICLEAVVLLGGKTMERLYGNGRKFASFSLTSPALVIEHLQY